MRRITSRAIPIFLVFLAFAGAARADSKPTFGVNRLKALEARTKIPLPGPKFARISEEKFEESPSGYGLWQGKVTGNGEINLSLQILRGSKLISSQHMGKVFLNPAEPSRFAFRSVLPKASGWHWQIAASAL